MLTCFPTQFSFSPVPLARSDRKCVAQTLNLILPDSTLGSSQWRLTWEQSSSGSLPLNPEPRSETTINHIHGPQQASRLRLQEWLRQYRPPHLEYFPAPAVFQLLWLLQEELTAVTEVLLIQHTRAHLCKGTWWTLKQGSWKWGGLIDYMVLIQNQMCNECAYTVHRQRERDICGHTYINRLLLTHSSAGSSFILFMVAVQLLWTTLYSTLYKCTLCKLFICVLIIYSDTFYRCSLSHLLPPVSSCNRSQWLCTDSTLLTNSSMVYSNVHCGKMCTD